MCKKIADGWNDAVIARCGIVAEFNLRPPGEAAIIVLKNFQIDGVKCLAVGTAAVGTFIEAICIFAAVDDLAKFDA